jgi:hypothetical protein
MPTQDERLASLEARVDAMSDLRGLILELRADMNGRLAEFRVDMNSRFTELRADMNARFAEVNSRFAEVNGRFDLVDRRLTALEDKGDRHFMWLIGAQVAVLMAVVSALLSLAYR